MKTVLELTQERDAALSEASKILDAIDEDGRSMTPDEESSYNVAVEKAEELNKHIKKVAKFEAAAAPKFDPPRQTGSGDPAATEPDDEPQRPKAAVWTPDHRVQIPRSFGKMRAFPKSKEGEMQAYRAGQWILATIYGNHRAKKWCQENGVGVRAALQESVNTAGGALVPEEFERAIIEIVEDYGVFRRTCRVTPMASDTKLEPRRTGGLTGYFVGEGAAGTESDATWDNVLLSAKKLMVLTRMSSEVQEDAVIDLADKMAEEIGRAFALKEDQCGFIGDGTSTYGGMRGVFVKGIDGSHQNAVAQALTAAHDTFSEIDYDDLANVMAKLHPAARAGARWYCSQVANALVFESIKAAGGGNTMTNLEGPQTPRYLGYPIEISSVLPEGATTDYTSLAMLGFGDLSLAATMGARRGVRVALSQEQYWEEDQIGVKGTERFDIVVHDLGNNTAIGSAGAVKSPFVILTGGSG